MRFVEVPAKEVFVNITPQDIQALYEVSIENVDFSAMIEITPEGVVITRLPDDDPAPDGDAL